jgi:hypothetical protein
MDLEEILSNNVQSNQIVRYFTSLHRNFPLLTWFSTILVTYLPVETPCQKNPCGRNAVCNERKGAGSCVCIPKYYGDPYVECKPECNANIDCPFNKACIAFECKDPCPGSCGANAECEVVNHQPICSCPIGYRGNPSHICVLEPSKAFIVSSNKDNNR